MARCFVVRTAVVQHITPVRKLTMMIHPVSQFTLLATMKKGNKPDFHKAAPAAKGKELYDIFIGKVRSLYHADRVKDGVFQAMMDVGLVNDGPVGVDYRCLDEAVRPCQPVLFHRSHAVRVALTFNPIGYH